jgi:hypothetical protein
MAKNTHLEHLEDDILNNGMEGGKNAIEFLRELGKMLSEPNSQIRVTTKWDGAPAIVCGVFPNTGQFFVGTKSVFSKTFPKICFTDADIDFYGYEGQLASKLKACLKHLPKLGIKSVLQGDLLFTEEDKIKENILGKDCIKFQPNTIVYCVEKGSDIYDNVDKAKVGIVFHTKYIGREISSMNATFGEINNFNKTSDVYATTATFKDASGEATFTTAELQKYTAAVNKAEGSLKQASKFLNILGETGQGKFLLSTLFKQFFNTYIRQGKSIPNVNRVIQEFSGYYRTLLQKEIDLKKTVTAKNKYVKIQEDGLKFIESNKRAIYFTIASYLNLQSAKSIVIEKLEKVKTLGTFLRTDTGYKVTAPEGFVAIRSGKALKLVDRLEFSRANFTATKDWDKTPAGYKGVEK